MVLIIISYNFAVFGLAYREKVRPGTGREAGLGHVGKGREQERKLWREKYSIYG